ncbi:MAG TPA: FAD-dependent oxidoreductase [bacterium]|nr:FAD-dependent oxidoreductase [bacterium]
MRFFGHADVIVVGGGTAGIVAAIASARSGAPTLLVEQSSGLGGTSTRGLMNCFVTFHDAGGRQAVRGIAQEIVDRLVRAGGSAGHTADTMGECVTRVLFDPFVLGNVLFEMAGEAGVELLLHSSVVDVLMDGDRLKGLVLHNKGGLQVATCGVCIDASGDGDVAAAAGAPFEKAARGELQPITLMYRLGGVDIDRWADFVRGRPREFEMTRVPDDPRAEGLGIMSLTYFQPFRDAVRAGELPRGISGEQVWLLCGREEARQGVVTVNGTRVEGLDGTNPRELTRAEADARRQAAGLSAWLRGRMPGFEQCYIYQTAQQLGVRETRRIVGDYMLTEDDVLSARAFEDAIAKGSTPIDIHGGADAGGENYWIKTTDLGIMAYDIPYRCLVPRNVEQLLVAGRCISTTHKAHGATRMQPVCMATGQAAGTAAALAAARAVPPRAIDVRHLQDALIQAGQVIREDQMV